MKRLKHAFKGCINIWGKIPQSRRISDAVALDVMTNSNTSEVFNELQDHMVDCSLQDNHVFGLIKIITKCYCKIRLDHLGKQATNNFSGTKIRKKLSKLVLFNHQ